MKPTLLSQILNRYRTSRDFNGFYFDAEFTNFLDEAIRLTKEGLVQVVSDEDYPNPHIRPWPPKRTIQLQIESLKRLNKESCGVCLYPTPQALKKYRVRNKYTDQPYRYEMSQGKGTLELVYFRFDVLEQYRNDPRFEFDYDDFGVSISISTDSYLDKDEPEEDKILIKHLGFSYDLSKYKAEDSTTPILRRVCAFYGDLAKLSPTHQQRWRTYQEVKESPTLKPHPLWWAQQMGHRPDGIGPFFRFFSELKALNELHVSAFGMNLFRSINRPPGFGWILRPSQSEWDSFIHQLDKLLSDNLQTSALNAMKAPNTNVDGNNLGTLKRLSEALIMRKIPENVAVDTLKPLFDIRTARQKPAHKLINNIINNDLIHKQVSLIGDVNYCLETLRRFWQQHPANKGWEEPEYLEENAKYYRM